MKQLITKTLAIVAILLCSWQTVVAQNPQFFYTPPSTTTGNNIPTGNTINKRQCVYYPSDFSTGSSGIIDKLYIKISAAASNITYGNLTILLGKAPLTYTQFTSATQPWITANMDTVFYSASTILSTNTGNWYVITLQKPYSYDNTSNLIFEFSVSSYSTSVSGLYATAPVTARSIYGSRTSTTASTLNDRLWQIGFDLQPVKPYNNASISQLVSPSNFCAGNYDVKVKVKNTGGNRINNVTVQWALDNVSQPPYSLITTLDTIGGTLFPVDTIITLGNATFNNTRTIKAWTEYPNNIVDTANLDDTINVTASPALSGNFTIGGTTPDYATIAAAVTALNAAGVCGPVTFNIDSASGPYAAGVAFGNVNGTSAANTITFNGNGAIVTGVTSPLMSFTTSSYISIKRLNIIGGTGYAGVGVVLTNQCHHLTFDSNTINVGTTSTATGNVGFMSSASLATVNTLGNNAQYVTFTNNDVIGGYYNFSLAGGASYANNHGHYIVNNKFRDFYIYGVYLYHADTVTFENNDINRMGRATVSTLYGLYLNISRNLKIHRNRLHDFGAAAYTGYPMYIVNCVNSVGYETEVTNNAFYNIPTTGQTYAIYSLTTALTGFNFYHNTIHYDLPVASTGLVRGMAFTAAATNINVKNNIINIEGGGTGVKTGIYVTTASASFISNNNVIRVASSASNNVGYWGAVQATMANWRSASGQDILSVDSNPNFTNVITGDLTPMSAYVENIGANVGVATDILGSTRALGSPDPGAFEKTRAGNNAGIQALLSPTNFCAGTHDIKVNVVNEGVNQITGVTLNWELNGMLQTPITWPGTIDTLGSVAGNDTVLTVGTALFGAGVNTTLKIWTSFPNSVTDTANNNDTITRIVRPGLAAGNYTVGSGGTYTNLTAAFADLNFGACGPIILELQSNYTSAGETFPLVVSASGTATNTVLIRPQGGATALTITSNNATATLDFNGADYITIDGRPGGFGNKELTITNTAATGAAIRFINGASYNQLKHLEARASNTTITSGAVFFSTATDTTANSYNTIDNCNINGNSATLNCIYSSGSAAPSDNKGNIVTNSNIYDFFTNVASGTANGILLEAGNNNWQIGALGNGNNFYQTAIRNSTSSPALTNAVGFRAVQLNNATINGTSIIGNRIGGSIPGIASSVFVIGDAIAATTPSHFIRAIDLVLAGTTTPTSIQGNTISDMTLYTGVSAGFAGIHALSGVVNTGNVTGNTIGATSGTGSINLFYKNTSTGINLYGIRYSSGATGLIQNNRIGSITADAAAGSAQLLCVYVSNAVTTPLTIANNTIGSLITPHSIQAAATSIAPINVMGLCASAASGSVITFENNVVSNLSQLNTLATTTNGLKGIYITGASAVGTVITGNQVNRLYSVSTNTAVDQSSAIIGINSTSSGAGVQTISNNTVHSLVSATPSVAVTVHGIFVGSTTTSNDNMIKGNTINKLAVNTSNQLATINGITLGTAVTNRMSVVNNMISLGYDSSDNAYTGTVAIHGILKTGAVASMYHNTVRVDGAGVGTAVFNTYAYRTTTSTLDTLMNNMFINTRSNASTGGTHYAISLPNAVNLTTNYNLYHATGAIGLFNSANQNALADWKTSTTQDANSVQTSVNFISNTDLHLNTGSIGNVVLAGTPIAHVSTDFDNQNRSTSYPYMGADENSTPVPVTLTTFTATATGVDVLATWTTASEINASHFNVEASVDGVNYRVVGNVKARGNSTINSNYSFTHKDAQRVMNASTIYYRLVSVDVDRTSSTSRRVLVNFNSRTGGLQNTVVYPNPFNNKLHIAISTEIVGDVSIAVYDIRGQLLHNQTNSLSNGTNTIEVNNMQALQKGIYFMRVTSANESKIIKLVKE